MKMKTSESRRHLFYPALCPTDSKRFILKFSFTIFSLIYAAKLNAVAQEFPNDVFSEGSKQPIQEFWREADIRIPPHDSPLPLFWDSLTAFAGVLGYRMGR